MYQLATRGLAGWLAVQFVINHEEGGKTISPWRRRTTLSSLIMPQPRQARARSRSFVEEHAVHLSWLGLRTQLTEIWPFQNFNHLFVSHNLFNLYAFKATTSLPANSRTPSSSGGPSMIISA